MPAESLNDLLPTTPDLRAERLAELKRPFDPHKKRVIDE